MPLQRNILLEQAQRAFQAGDIVQADLICRDLLKGYKNDLAVLHLMGSVAFARNDLNEAARLLRKCLSLQPSNASLHYELGQTLLLQAKHDEALNSLDRALRLNPNDVRPYADKADILERRGEREAAWNVLKPFLEAGTDSEGMAVVAMRIYEHEARNAEAMQLGSRHLARSGIDPMSRAHLLRRVARLYEKAGQYDAAFKAFSEAIQTTAVRFDIEELAQRFDALIATFSAQNLPRLPRSKNKSELPIFIACMPRSGSTLVEQIIHAHPRAFGAGEITNLDDLVTNLQTHIESFQQYPACIADLTQKHVDELSRQYLDAIARQAPGAARVVNKNLRNYVHLGMIWVLFPGARVVHIRRDPLDNGFGCYIAALQPGQFPWVTDLRTIGLVWRQYERLMDHWREVLDIPMLEIQYEELVDDTEAQIRRLIDFCGLEWDDRCLRYWEAERNVMTLSYDQVRQPIFKSAVKRYEKYEQFLGPLKQALVEGDGHEEA